MSYFEHLQLIESNDDLETIYANLKDCNVLHNILKEETMCTLDKRNTLMKKYFHLCPIHTIYFKTDDVIGSLSEQVKTTRPFFVYIPIEDQLRRQLGDPTVFSQYLQSGNNSELYSGLGRWAGDFFQSPEYQEILKTIDNSNPFPTLLLGLYRLVF